MTRVNHRHEKLKNIVTTIHPETHSEAWIRPFEPRDETAVVSLWNRTLWADPVTARRFENMVLLDPNFDRRGCLVAELGGEIIGFLLAVVRDASWFGCPLKEDTACLPVIFVVQEHRRKGIGSALLGRVLKHLRNGLRREALIDICSPFFYSPGIDQQSYPEALPFFISHGFKPQERRCSMDISLSGRHAAAETEELAARLAAERIRVLPFHRSFILATMEFFGEHFPNWTYYFHRKMAEPAGDDDIVVALHGDEVVGYCQQFEGEHVGPFGVAPAMRGRGVGTLILHNLLARMQQKKFRYAWFGKAEPQAENFFLRNGFKVARVFTPMRLTL